jgi:TRAP transporter TAXI family solute receptor
MCSLGASAFLLMGHTPYRQWQVYRKNRLIFVASEADEVSLRLGASIAEALAARLPQSKAMMATTATAVDVVGLLASSQLEVALLTSDDAYEAVKGVGKFSGRPVPLRALAVFGSSVLHLVTLADRGIAGVPDLKGKVLATGPAGGPTETLTLRVLEAYGIDPGKDLRQESLAGERAATALRSKRVGAIARADTVASGAVLELASTPGLAIALLEHGDALPKIEARYGPVYGRGTIPKGAYPGVGTDVGAVAVAHLLVCREDFPDDRAHQIAKTLAAPPGSRPLLPFHPGALQFYDGDHPR